MARFADRWYAWWRGDQVEADFTKQVSLALRELAYETMVEAKKRVIKRAWGFRFDTKMTKKGKYRSRWREDVRRRTGPSGKRWRYYVPSRPGESPTNQTGTLRGSINYAFRGSGARASAGGLILPENANLLESFAGAIEMDTSWHWTMTNGKASHALEWGGESISRRRVGKGRSGIKDVRVRIEARPFMRPAGADVLRSGLLRRHLENSVRNQPQPPNLAIGWMSS
jgi:hypothetical protein